MVSSKITTLDQLRTAATRSLQASGEVAQAAAEAIEEVLNALKQDKAQSVTVVIPASGWALEETTETEDEEAADEVSGYPYYYDIAVDGVTASNRAEVTIALASLAAATSCGLCPTNETITGAIRMRTVSVPDEDITAEYWIEDGKES